MENPIKMDDLGIPLFLETPISMVSLRFSLKGDCLEKHCDTPIHHVATEATLLPQLWKQKMTRLPIDYRL